jgi:hypothetical protein
MSTATSSDLHINAHFLHSRLEDEVTSILLRSLFHTRGRREGGIARGRVPDRAIVASYDTQGRRLRPVVKNRVRSRRKDAARACSD